MLVVTLRKISREQNLALTLEINYLHKEANSWHGNRET